jgi:hypothetical protein
VAAVALMLVSSMQQLRARWRDTFWECSNLWWGAQWHQQLSCSALPDNIS